MNIKTVKIIIASILFFLFSNASAEDGGVSIKQTRVIFSASDKAQSLTVTNQGLNSYLIHVRIFNDVEMKQPAKFLVTPPLSLLKGHSQQTLRILSPTDILLTDQESVYYVGILAVPSQNISDNAKSAPKINLGFRFVVKLFFRPKNLEEQSEEEGCKLKFSANDDGYSIFNPTPYFKTLGRLVINNEEIKLSYVSSMIDPEGTRQYKHEKPTHNVEWNTIDDYGGLSRSCKLKL